MKWDLPEVEVWLEFYQVIHKISQLREALPSQVISLVSHGCANQVPSSTRSQGGFMSVHKLHIVLTNSTTIEAVITH